MPEEEEHSDDEILDEMSEEETVEEDEEKESEKTAQPESEDEEEIEENGKDGEAVEEQEPEKVEQIEEEKEPGKGRGSKIGELTMDLDSTREEKDILVYLVNVSVKGEENSFEFGRYDTHLGWIEDFGLPPFNEWVILKDFNYMKKNFSGELNDEMKYSENVEIEEKGVSGYRINLQRISGSQEEYYNTRIVEVPGENGKISLTECMSSKGVYTDTVRNKKYENVKPAGIPGLTDYEERYAEKIVGKEGEPNSIVVKKAVVDGPMPAIYRKIFPFWDTEDFDEMPLRSIELGYLGKGDSESDLDKRQGEWYKLFTFQEFDQRYLEIVEGDYSSKEAEIEEEKVTAKQHYEKKLYSYTPEAIEDE